MSEKLPHMWQPYPVSPGQIVHGPPPTKTQAIWALVLAIIPTPLTWIASVILAIVVLNKPKDLRGGPGKGLSIASFGVIILWIIGFVGMAAAGLFGEAERKAAAVGTERGDVSVTSLFPGDCLVDDPSVAAQLTVELVPCSETHKQEVYANFTLASGPFPGEKSVARLAEGGCFKRFENYVGIDPVKSELTVMFLHPLSESWDLTREVTCMISDGGSSIDSLKDSGASEL